MTGCPPVTDLDSFIRVVASHEVEAEYKALKQRLADAEVLLVRVARALPGDTIQNRSDACAYLAERGK